MHDLTGSACDERGERRKRPRARTRQLCQRPTDESSEGGLVAAAEQEGILISGDVAALPDDEPGAAHVAPVSSRVD
jgi:hypothetical protein